MMWLGKNWAGVLLLLCMTQVGGGNTAGRGTCSFVRGAEGEIHSTFQTNTFCNFDEDILQFWQIHLLGCVWHSVEGATEAVHLSEVERKRRWESGRGGGGSIDTDNIYHHITSQLCHFSPLCVFKDRDKIYHHITAGASQWPALHLRQRLSPPGRRVTAGQRTGTRKRWREG